MNRSYCCHRYKGEYGCGNPTAFVARKESEETASVFVCGKHLAASLTPVPKGDRWIVVPLAPGERARRMNP